MKRFDGNRLVPVIALMTLMLAVCVEGSEDEWVHYFTTSGGEPYYYDRSSIVFSSGDDATVLGRIEIDQARLIGARTAKGFSIKGYENYSHTIQKYEINAQDKKYRIVSQTDYDSAGEILDYDCPESPPRWQPIPPDSAINGLSIIIWYVEKKRLERLREAIEKDLEKRKLRR